MKEKGKTLPKRTPGGTAFKHARAYRGVYLMATPVLVAALIFYYLPMFGIRYAFFTYKGIDISNGNLMLMIAIILWISAIASAFVDNIPFAATMIPIISSLSATQGVELSILAWALAMGTDIGGSATPIGASANVVGIATAAKAGHMIKWGKYCKVMAPATIIVVGISMLMIYARYL